jgi:hypothetical protein
VQWSGGIVRPAPKVDAVFGAAYDVLLVNPEDAARFRTADRRSLPPAALEGDYFGSTPNGWVKIVVNKRGFCRATYEDLDKAVTASSIDLATVRLYGGGSANLDEAADVLDLPSWMQQVALRVDDRDGDGEFEPGDALLFFGRAVDGWGDDYGVDTLRQRWVENQYTSENMYWLTWGGTWNDPLRRIQSAAAPPAGGAPVREFAERKHLELNREYDHVLFETRYRWEKWWWQALSDGETGDPARLYAAALADPDTTRPMRLWARFWGANSSYSSYLRDHYLKVQMNGQVVAERSWEGWTRQDVVVSGTWGRRNNILAVTVPTLTDTTNDNRRDIINFAWFEMDYTRRLRASDGLLEFSSPDSSGPVTLAVTGLAGGVAHQLFDITDPFVPVELAGGTVAASTDGDSLAFGITPGGSAKRLYLLRATKYLAPLRVSRDAAPSSYLRERTDRVDYIIVTDPAFASAASAIRDLRESSIPGIEDPRAVVVSVEDIYDEFSWGLPDVSAIRNFFEWAYNNWNGGDPNYHPTYGLLLGDATFDPRDFDADGLKTYVLAYETSPSGGQQYVVDDWYASFDGPRDDEADMFLGRLPAANLQEAEALVGKTLHYLSHPDRSGWSIRTLLVADDICQAGHPDGLGFAHQVQTEDLDRFHVPRPLDRVKLYLIEYGSSCSIIQKPTAQADLLKLIEQGAWLLNYAGHGGTTQLADERVLDRQNVPSLTNIDRLPFFLTASCAVGKFDSQEEGLGEAMVKNPAGGSVATFAATEVAFASDNELLNNAVMDLLFPRGTALVDTMTTIGFATVIAKNTVVASTAHRYVLQGDPALRLAIPPLRVDLERTDAQGARAGAPRDTLLRGERVSVSGTVRGLGGSIATDFNGRAHVLVSDSEIEKVPAPGQPLLDYFLPGAPIYRGDLNVTAGRFDATFVVPRVLNSETPRGLGRIRIHVASSSNEGVGVIDSLFMSTSIVTTADTAGPVISFVDFPGGSLRAGQKLRVSLSDSSGINITELQQSRAVTVTVEDRFENDLLLTDLTAQLTFVDGYQQGEVDYVVPGRPTLSPGQQYTLVVRAADSQNNLSMLRQDFTFLTEGELKIEQAYAFPSPTTGATRIFFKPTTDAGEVTVKILTVSGRTIRTLNGSVDASQWASQPIPWDGRDEEGDQVAIGVYFFKIEARASDGGSKASVVGKVAVSR